jgi:hypothetical protein
MERITGDVKHELSRFGAQGAMPEIVEAWPEAVGAMVAANAWPARIARDGTLHVNTSSSSWAFELGQLAAEIAAKLAAALGEKAPNALRFGVGHLPEPAAPESEEARTEVPEPSPEALELASAMAAAIEDEELRKKVEKAVALGLSKPPYDHSF